MKNKEAVRLEDASNLPGKGRSFAVAQVVKTKLVADNVKLIVDHWEVQCVAETEVYLDPEDFRERLGRFNRQR